MSATLTATAQDPAALPVPLTAFIGRELELAEVRRLCAGTRVLTLTGAGGSGKTRLALELAARVADEGLPVHWVELAPLADPAALAQHVAVALGIPAEGAASAEQALAAHLASAESVLVLDNCEHVVDAAARLVAFLVGACPRLRVLTTSREALGVGGERSWLVPPLALPPEGSGAAPETLLRSEAVRLFVERAQEASRRFTLTPENAEAVARICRRLDGLPLAIELAAARVAVLAPSQIAARLDDRFSLLTSGTRASTPRQRTLRGAVDWSYDLLAGDERLLLERLAVFAGGFTLDAAEAVCGWGDLAPSRVLDLLAALATKSLVAMQEEGGVARYRLLETIREYAAERHRGRAEGDSLAELHARYYLALARAAEPELLLGRPARMAELDLEHDNVLAALRWSAERREGAHLGLPLAWAVMWYWFHRQRWREGFAQFERALATADAPAAELQAAALHGLGLFGLYVRDPQSGARLAEADRLWRAAGNGRWLAFTLLVETVAASLRKDVDAAQAFAEEMLAVASRQPDPWDAALAKAHGLVPVLVWRGRWEEASRLLDEALAAFRARGYTIGVAYALDAQAFVALQLGDRPRAVRLAAASLREDPHAENRWLAGRSLRILGAIAAEAGDDDRAMRLFGAADAMYEAIGAASLTAERRAVNEVPARLAARMGPERFGAALEAGRALTFREAVALALEGTEGSTLDDPATLTVSGSWPTVLPAHAADVATPATGSAPVAVPEPTPTPTPPTTAAPDAPLSVRALGPLEIRLHGRLLGAEAWPYAKPRELLLYLLVHPEGRTREQAGLDFWPEVSAAQVKNNFHVTLHHLRKALGDPGWIRFERGRYRVAGELGVAFDVARFEEAVVAACRRLRAAPTDHEPARALEDAISGYRGGFLDEAHAGDWHLATRDRLARRFEEGVEALAAHHEAVGAHAEAARAWQRLADADPLHEEAARRLMLALARDGRRSEALRVFDRLVRGLRTELDAEPEPEVAAVAERLRAGAPV